MAYLTNLTDTCPNCNKRKTAVRLYNNRNSRIGDFCRPCGKLFLERLKREEEARYKRPEEPKP